MKIDTQREREMEKKEMGHEDRQRRREKGDVKGEKIEGKKKKDRVERRM